MSRVLVIAPHPDDEAIGCGGAIRKHVLDGDQVHTLFLTSGEKGAYEGMEPDEAARYREREAGVASQVLQTQKVTFWREPDGGLVVTSELLRRMRVLLAEEGPDLIYAPHGAESHPDHQAAARLVWQTRMETPCRFYEVWTPLPQPDHLIDITAYASAKRSAIRAHKSQLGNALDEAILSLNHYRGLLHFPGVMYAEAFGGQP